MRRSRTFAGMPQSVRAARRFTTEALLDTPQEIVEAIVLMVSELATNSIRFAASDFTVDIERARQQIRVEVTDGGTGTPTLRDASPQDLSGRGLMIVHAMSEDWGIAPSRPPPGKTVWFTLTPSPVG
jgi:anti-sigma regulatory factor (Ser/Thr protein kinase)